MSEPDSTRRDFLTGKAAQQALRRQGDALADALQDETRAIPQGADTVRLETRAMACQWAVIMNPGPPRQVMVASDGLAEVHRVEDLLTVYRDDSEIARLNASAAQAPQPLMPELFQFLQRCQTLWRATAGAFDPAAGALIRLWKAARQSGRVPAEEEVLQALASSGMQRVLLDEARQTLEFDVQGLSLDFGAVGKGSAADLVAAHLDREDLTDYLVHGGRSSLFARGRHNQHDGWPVGIKNPLFTEQRYATVLLKDQGMSTSGSNIQYFRHQGKRYGHQLDPRTGWPAEGLLSVTVIAPLGMDADALSTAFYVLGLDKSLRYCDEHPEVAALLVPPPERGRTLSPIVRNLPADRLFWELAGDGPERSA